MKFIDRIKERHNRVRHLLIWIEIIDMDSFKRAEKNSCKTHIHPIIKGLPEEIRERVVENINEVIDLIRDYGDTEYL